VLIRLVPLRGTETPTAVPRYKDRTHPTGPSHHCGGVRAGIHTHCHGGGTSTYTLRSPKSKSLRSYSRGPAFPGARPCLKRAHAHRWTSGRYTFRALRRVHVPPQRWQLGTLPPMHTSGRSTAVVRATRRRSADTNPPAICCRSQRNLLCATCSSLPVRAGMCGEGRLSGSSPIFPSRNFAGGWDGRRHCGGTSPSAATAVAADPRVSPPASLAARSHLRLS